VTRLRLVPNWKQAWRFASVLCAALLLLASMVQADVLPLIRPQVPAELWPWVSGGFALLIAVLRVVKQNLPPPDAPPAVPPAEAKP
jgi:hypothetical protein